MGPIGSPTHGSIASENNLMCFSSSLKFLGLFANFILWQHPDTTICQPVLAGSDTARPLGLVAVLSVKPSSMLMSDNSAIRLRN
jgi:hypothetical protein